jgi:hypothetical protein
MCNRRVTVVDLDGQHEAGEADAQAWQQERDEQAAEANAKGWQQERDERLIAQHEAAEARARRKADRQLQSAVAAWRRDRAAGEVNRRAVATPPARRRGAGRPGTSPARAGGDSGDPDEPEPPLGGNSERVAYFAMLADGEHPIELRARRGERWRKHFAATPEQADRLAAGLIAEGCDTYAAALPRLGRDRDAQLSYAPARVLVGDLDSARAVRKCELFEPQPSAIVESGGVDGDGTPKQHAYWPLTRPLSAGDYRRHASRLAHHLEADPGSTDAAHIFRVPGSRHHETGRVARLVRFTGEAVDLHELTGDLPDAPTWQPPGPRPPKTDDELIELFCGHYSDHRHDRYRSVVGVLLRRCPWLPPEVVFELSVAWAETHTRPCKSRAELCRNFDNVLAREQARADKLARLTSRTERRAS